MSDTPTPDVAAPTDKATTTVDPSVWDAQVAVTGRPADQPPANSTFAERAAARNKQQKTETAKADDDAEKATAKRRPRSKAS